MALCYVICKLVSIIFFYIVIAKLLGTSCPGYELSWVRVVLGTSRLEYELSRVRVVHNPIAIYRYFVALHIVHVIEIDISTLSLMVKYLFQIP